MGSGVATKLSPLRLSEEATTNDPLDCPPAATSKAELAFIPQPAAATSQLDKFVKVLDPTVAKSAKSVVLAAA